jgi:hypothetical protein
LVTIEGGEKLIEMTTPNQKETPGESPEPNEENKQPEEGNEADKWDLRMGAVQGTPITAGGDGELPRAAQEKTVTAWGEEGLPGAVRGTPITAGGDEELPGDD